MKHDEGIIGFSVHQVDGSPATEAFISEINLWRSHLRALELIGQSADRYGGYSYGNISRRLPPYDAPPHARRFLITVTQSGGLDTLTAAQYAVVCETHAERNRLVVEGPGLPSSESLTHATVYAQSADLRWVMHAHSPELWTQSEALGILITRADVPYGSPAMSEEVRRLFNETDVMRKGMFSMGGHEDGIVAFGVTAEEAASVLLDSLARALEIV